MQVDCLLEFSTLTCEICVYFFGRLGCNINGMRKSIESHPIFLNYHYPNILIKASKSI